MKMRHLGKTGLYVSEVGFGGEWLQRHTEEEGAELIRYAGEKGVNIIDCWMPDPKSRDIIGKGIEGQREKWIIQGHVGSTWQDGQYVRTRDMKYVRPAFEDILLRMHTDYMDLGMIHYVDSEDEWKEILKSDYLKYIMQLKNEGTIRHIGLSTHNPRVGKMAAESGFVEMMLFSINPAFDMLPAMDDIDKLFEDVLTQKLKKEDGERAEFYRICEQNDVGLTVMKAFLGGKLLNSDSPLGAPLTPVQCIHYALSRPAVGSVLCGYDSKSQIDAAVSYESASDEEKNYESVLEDARLRSCRGECTYCGHCKPCAVDLDIAMINKLYDLATAQPSVPDTVKGHYMALKHKASECLGCKACEERCPFGVSIAERMEKAAELFEK